MPENLSLERRDAIGGTGLARRSAPRRLARGETAGRTRLRARQGHMICSFGAVVRHTHPRLPCGCGNGKFGDAGPVEFGTQAELRIEAQVPPYGTACVLCALP